MVVAYRNGAPVRLGEVANVIDSVEDDKQMALIYGGEYGTEGTARRSPWRSCGSPAATRSR